MNNEHSDPDVRVKAGSIPHVSDQSRWPRSQIPEAAYTTSRSEGSYLSDSLLFSRPAKPAGNDHDGEVTRQDTGLLGKPPIDCEKLDNRAHEPAGDLTTSSTVPQIRIQQDQSESSSSKQEDVAWLSPKTNKSTADKPKLDNFFAGITLDIPSGGLSEDVSTDKMKFSNRGSMLIDGAKSKDAQPAVLGSSNGVQSRPVRSASSLRGRPGKILSVDEETLSQKVRSFYEVGGELPAEGDGSSSLGRKMGLRWQDAMHGQDAQSTASVSRATSQSDLRSITSSIGQRQGTSHETGVEREESELAGGIEDWHDVENGDVDRYGFIVPKSPTSEQFDSNGVKRSQSSRGPRTLQRVSSSLQLASDTPRRKNTLTKSAAKAHAMDPSASPPGPARPTSSSSYSTRRQPSFRYAANRLPHNRDRKLMDEASDMLTVPPTAPSTPDNGNTKANGSHVTQKEIEREEKWRKMAKVVSNGPKGGGMVFEFDTSSSKLIERTWKGIPDRWRATAWHAFLSESAKKKKDSVSDEDLIESYHEYLLIGSPDDVQIDIDVPRTISSHIMFRRRYRGGQRLLFHVLHAMSLHFPDTGYVQGMATLAATLLAYYEEDRAFVMLVRLWELRGLDKLYRSGFGGLMEALDDFEKKWLGQGELAAKLEQLSIGPTAYGTRWYLTLFNYSIPFPAQLRVWDVFMLLGDDDQPGNSPDSTHFGTTLDVLHATSAALIDGMRDILLESDFENGMKVLTSWIPIKDEDLFMRVAKVEWKVHKRKG